MREVLENSDSAFISFFDEIKFINRYINISQKRLTQALDFSIQIPENFKLKSQFIPPMLLQPYIENAIIHGFANANQVCKLLIEITQNEGLITCKIKDNGIGRSISKSEKSRNFEQYRKSMAMGINKRRIDLLNESSDRNFKVKVIDCFDDKGNATGTEVVISFEQITDEINS